MYKSVEHFSLYNVSIGSEILTMEKNKKPEDKPPSEVMFSEAQLETIRQLVESVNKMVAKSIPDLSNTLKAIGTMPRITTPAFDSIASSIVPALNKTMSSLIPPSTTSAINSAIAAISKQQTSMISEILKPFNEKWIDQFSNITKNIRKIVLSSYPPNWRGDGALNLPSNLDALLLDEGLALAWVPSKKVLVKLFAASDAGERRKILFNNRASIINTCFIELQGIDEPHLKEYVDFALESAESIRAGHWRSSQALSTNLIDSTIIRLFDQQSKTKLTSHSQRLDWKEYPVRSAVVFGGIWGSYARYQPGDSNIPQRYTRHASAHAVSNRQYTKINALIALMHVTALLKLISEDFDNN